MNQLPVVAPAALQPSRDVKAAQRAFFQAALGQVQSAAAAPAVAPAPRPQASGSARTAAPDTADGRRFLPPGSLLDIKI